MWQIRNLGAVLLLASGCIEQGGGSISAATAVPSDAPVVSSLQVDLTDAPPELGSIAAVYVSVQRAEVHLVAKSAALRSNPDDRSIEDDSLWETLAPRTDTFELVGLQNDVTATVGGVDLPKGKVDDLRLFFDPNGVNSVQKKDGSVCPLDVSLAAQKGLRVSEPFDLISLDQNQLTTVVLDLDLSTSVNQDADCAFSLRPRLKVKRQGQGPRPAANVFGNPPRFGGDHALPPAANPNGQVDDNDVCHLGRVVGRLRDDRTLCRDGEPFRIDLQGAWGDTATVDITAPNGAVVTLTANKTGVCDYRFEWTAAADRPGGLYTLDARAGTSGGPQLSLNFLLAPVDAPQCESGGGRGRVRVN